MQILNDPCCLQVGTNRHSIFDRCVVVVRPLKFHQCFHFPSDKIASRSVVAFYNVISRAVSGFQNRTCFWWLVQWIQKRTHESNKSFQRNHHIAVRKQHRYQACLILPLSVQLTFPWKWSLSAQDQIWYVVDRQTTLICALPRSLLCIPIVKV